MAHLQTCASISVGKYENRESYIEEFKIPCEASAGPGAADRGKQGAQAKLSLRAAVGQQYGTP